MLRNALILAVIIMSAAPLSGNADASRCYQIRNPDLKHDCLARASDLVSIGSNGDIGVLLGSIEAARVEVHPVGRGYTGVFLPSEEMHFGA